MTVNEMELPMFRYFPDPVGNRAIVRKDATCPCCGAARDHMYVGPIYCGRTDVQEVCPWCIADGSAAEKWSATFNDLRLDTPAGVPNEVVREIAERTPGYETWQGNRWLFSPKDAMIFLGEVVGKQLLAEGNAAKIEACLGALGVEPGDVPQSLDILEIVDIGSTPAIYLFQDRESGEFRAYYDMS